MLIFLLFIPEGMVERVNSVDETCIIKGKGGKFLCKLIHVAELKKHTMGKNVSFKESERDKLLNDHLERLKEQGLEPDFYFERWPKTRKYCDDAYLVPSPIVHLEIQFYKKVTPVTSERPRIDQYQGDVLL